MCAFPTSLSLERVRLTKNWVLQRSRASSVHTLRASVVNITRGVHTLTCIYIYYKIIIRYMIKHEKFNIL